MVEEAVGVCIPREIVATLKGRRFTLVGFPAEEANLIARVVKDTKSLSYSVHPVEAGPGSDTVKACDLILLNVSADLAGSEWLDIGAHALDQKAVLLAGFPTDLLDFPTPECAAQDVLVRPFEPEEMLLRSYRLLSRLAGARTTPGTGKKPARVMVTCSRPCCVITTLSAVSRPTGRRRCMERGG